MPCAVIPIPALNSAVIHSEYSPTCKVNFSDPTTNRADFPPTSGLISYAIRTSPAPSFIGLSGPGTYDLHTPFFRSIGTRIPPSRNLSVDMRVVHRQNVPWLPFRSGTHIPDNSTP